MATVMISNDLLRDVRWAINGMREKESKPVHDDLNKAITSIVNGYTVEDAKRKLWGDYMHLIPPVMPEDWCEKVNSVSFELTFIVDPVANTTYRVSREVYVSAFAGSSESRIPAPPNVGRYAKLKDMSKHCTPEQHARVCALHQELVALRAKYSGLEDQIVGILRAHPSLNKALFAYPELKTIVPKEYLDRVDQPVERTPRTKKEVPAAPVPVLDREALLNSIAIHNLSNE